jgi:DNA segregation ATPase FtsK/SpoIIIE, S-DNA-T family
LRLKLELQPESGTLSAITVTAEATATVADVAAAIRAGQTGVPCAATDLSLQILDNNDTSLDVLPPQSLLPETNLRSGQRVRVVQWADSHRFTEATAPPARLRITAGPGSGQTFDLHKGPNVIGRQANCEVTLDDLMVSRKHARVIVGDQIEIVDMNSANGVQIADELVDHATLGPRDKVLIGDTEIVVERTAPPSWSAGQVNTEFNRSPLVRQLYQGRTFSAPKPPGKRVPAKLPWVAMVAPLLMGAVMYAMTQNLLSIIFVALSPVMAIGTYMDRRWTDGKSRKEEKKRFDEDLASLTTELAEAVETEKAARCAEVPALAAVVESGFSLNPDLWHRRPDDEAFLLLNLGYGRTESRNTIVLPERGETDAETWSKLEALVDDYAFIDDVPVLADLNSCANLGLAGEGEWLVPVARNLVSQLTCLHSPAELVLAAIASSESQHRWNWLLWLPHVGSAHSPMAGSHLAATTGTVSSLVAGLEELVAQRRAQGSKVFVPSVVLLVENDAPVERGRLVSLAEDGPEVGVHLLWVADRHENLPAACHGYLVRDGATGAVTAGFVKERRTAQVTRIENSAESRTLDLARHLAPIQDAGAPVLDQSGIPRSVSYLALAGPQLATDPQVTVERWQENGSVLDPSRPRSKTPATLRALVGQGAQGEFMLDLRAQGPHALVGGTSGAGKSEFLQAWVLGMAANHSPQRVTFLFVDYKGGSAFADCVRLPHTVGLVTDLSPHLVRRALTSLRAELRYREHLLNQKNAKDLISLERTGDPDCPPSLVIVVDEFAALVQEVPDFVDGVVDVAQRGRSLGLHLILATQRPAGVIKGNLRANTALRIALRMADEADSADVIDTGLASEFDPRIPGRGAVRTGPGRVSLFQTGYTGGITTDEPEPARIEIESLNFGPGTAWEIPVSRATSEASDEQPPDISRVVDMIGAAAQTCRLAEPRKPWLPELGTHYSMEELLQAHADRTPTGRLLLGIADDPDNQAQHPVFYNPDTDGNLAVYGTSGTGKSALLRSIAFGAAAQSSFSRTDVYGLDFGTAGLGMLDPLPNVGSIIEGSDQERVSRLLRQLVDLLDERSGRYAEARSGSITEYRLHSARPDEARILLLVDGFSAFREEYEISSTLGVSYARFSRLLVEGRAVGIHVVLAAERPGAVPSALSASIQRRLVLRQADEVAYASLNIPKDILTDAPPGRGVFGGQTNELQIAVPTGSSTPVQQAAAIDKLAERLIARGTPSAAAVQKLPSLVQAADVPTSVAGLPVLGIGEAELAPLGFPAQGAFLIAGMPGSGRTSALRWVSQSLRRWNSEVPMYYVGPRRSRVHEDSLWTKSALDLDAVRELTLELKPLVDKPAGAEPGLILVIEGLGEYVSTPVESSLVEVIKAARRNGHLVVGEQETSAWGSGWPLISEIRNARHGIVMQPDPADGDMLFKESFPRIKRTEYPLGRGVYVRSGKQWTVQVPLPG